MATQYTIRLNLGGNIIQRLTHAEQIMDRINRKAERMNTMPGRIASGGSITSSQRVASSQSGGGRAYPFIPRQAMPRLNRYYEFSRKLGGRGSRESFNKRFNEAFRQTQRFRNEFARNMFTITGWQRNFGNFFGSLKSFGGALAKAVPIIGTATAILGTYAALWAIPKLIGAGIYGIGNKAMNSQSMTDAISNRMQLNMARKGLGSNYENTLSQASRMASEYGYSRSGMMSMINTMSGFEVNGKEIGTDVSIDLARITGKVAQLGGRPYDIVGQNMQQLLASENPNMRDIRELLHAAPILSKYALQEMKKTGISNTDPREWLKDRGNMIKSLYRLDEEMQPPAVAAARGRVNLARENFWIGLSGMDKMWNDIAMAGERMWTELLAKFESWYADYDSAKFQKNLNEFVDGVGTITKWLLKAADALAGYANYISSIREIAMPGGKFVREHFGQNFFTGRTTQQPKNTDEKELLTKKWASEAVSIYLNSSEGIRAYKLNKGTPKEREEARDKAEKFLTNRYESKYRGEIVSNMFSIPMPVDSLGNGPTLKRPNYEGFRTVASKAEINQEDVANMFSKIANLFYGGKTTNNNDTKKIEDLTAGSKSLYINFNAPLVSLPTTIQNASNPTQLIADIEKRIEEYSVRGLQIALYNATRMV